MPGEFKMDRSERFAIIERLLCARRAVGFEELRERLEISRPTLYRDLAYLRDRMGVPLVHDRETGRYRLDAAAGRHELPGLWFSAEEIHALLTMQRLLAELDPGGLLGPHIEPLKERLARLLETGEHPAEDVARRIRILAAAARRYPTEHFQAIAAAVMERRRLRIDYRARGNGAATRREVSPQRLVHYRDNWYLDAWCHLRGELRSFAVDAMQAVERLEAAAIELDDAHLDAILGTGYGIFAGREVKWATLRFTPERARWVAAESWHPGQEGRFLEDGRYELRVPYSADPELVMDILKYGPDCEVVGPGELRGRVVQRVREMAEKYSVPGEEVPSVETCVRHHDK